jgi:hypothetical protein
METVREDQTRYIQGTYNGILDVSFSPLVDIQDPLLVRFDTVRRQANDPDIALGEIRFTARDFRKFGGAHRGEVIRVRKKDGLAL